MTSMTQKIEEKFYAEQFAEKMKYNWRVEISLDEEEYPDLIVSTSHGNIGLEATQYFPDKRKKGSKTKQKEKYNSELLRKLSSMYYEKKDRPISVKISGLLTEDNIQIILDCLLKIDVEMYKIIDKVRCTPFFGQ